MQDNIIVFPEPPAGDTARLVTHTLPVSLTSLIGREHEVKAIEALLLRPDIRLLTLTGTAGVGKTRLALEVARDLAHDFADGVHVVSLAPLSDPAFVISTIAHSLGLTESGSQPLLDRLKISQRDKQRLLLLDNFEHVISAAAPLVELLEACPAVKLLVTSREVLRLRAEHQFTVPPLALPDSKHLPDDQSLAHVPAVQLFLQRTQAIRSDFQVTTDNAAAIAEICLRLDGLPLAIELAAARVKVLSLQALLTRLEHRLQLLTGGARDLPERQHTLRNTLQWSYDLLSEEEQRLFRRLAVFVGGCTLEAVEVVCCVLGSGGTSVLEGVASLIDKSLLQQWEQEGEEPRFVMLETIREYGLECLTASGERDATWQAHAGYYVALAEKAEPELAGPQQVEWLKRLEREHDNLRAALWWLLEQGEINQSKREMALRLGGALRQFWLVRGHLSEGRTFLERALAGGEGAVTSNRAQALKAAAHLAYVQGDTDRAEVLSEECLARCRELGDMAGIALSLRLLGFIAEWRSNFVVAYARTEESLALFREVGDKEGIAGSLVNLGWMVSLQGEYARASALLEESLALFREWGNLQGIAFSLIALSNLLFISQGDPAKVRALLEEGHTLSRELGYQNGTAWALGLLGQVFLQQGDTVKARSLLEESVVLSRDIGNRNIAWELIVLGRVVASEGDYTAARAHYEDGLALAREVGDKVNIAFCLEGLAGVVAVQGEPAWAARLYGAAESLRESVGIPIPPVYRADYERSVAAARILLGEKAFAAAWAEGRTMTLEHVLDGAPRLSATPSSSRPVDTTEQGALVRSPEPAPLVSASLTPRESEVLRLLAQGLTSAQIAERLVIGVVTVNFHVRSIYSKLGVTSRAAATRYALEHHLV
jgi:predicted ATPase/DNA-binding CsgD family transcriptional regulator